MNQKFDTIILLIKQVAKLKYKILSGRSAERTLTLADKGNINAKKYYDIYEPLLLFFAIGGTIRSEHGWLEIGKISNTIGGIVSQALEMPPIDIYELTAEMRH